MGLRPDGCPQELQVEPLYVLKASPPWSSLVSSHLFAPSESLTKVLFLKARADHGLPPWLSSLSLCTTPGKLYPPLASATSSPPCTMETPQYSSPGLASVIRESHHSELPHHLTLKSTEAHLPYSQSKLNFSSSPEPAAPPNLPLLVSGTSLYLAVWVRDLSSTPDSEQ